MSTFVGDPMTQLAFSLYEGKGVFAVLLGSGLSRSAEIPTGWEITLDLIRRLARAQGVDDQSDWAAWYRKQTGQEPDYSALLEELASSPEERRSILQSYIEPTEEDRELGRKLPTKAHYAIAGLVRGGYIRVILTTNFDRLVENALRERGIEPTVVASIDALKGAEPISHSACYVLKLHGDYKDARILNTGAELGKYPAPYDALLDRVIDEYGLIVCGWSDEWDLALRSALLRAPNRRYPIFWAVHGKLGSGAEELVNQRGARVVPITDADSFFSGLEQRVETLAQTQRQNPLSIELLVNSTKRLLAKTESRIQLDELFTQETVRVLTRLDSTEFTPQAPWEQIEFRARVQKYEAITESLASMAGVLGRWGDGNELPLVLDAIRSLYVQAEKASNGLTGYLNLRSYPAVLVFSSYGLGLTQSGRWGGLHKLFDALIDREHGESRRVVKLLFLWSWKGTEGDAWKQLEGFDKRKTPLSDHLLDLLSEWGKRFIGLAHDFELLFERYEMLGSLAYLEQQTTAGIEQELAGTQPRGFAWMPVGRVGWHSNNADKLVAELQEEPMRSSLTEANFGKGDPGFIDLFIRNFQHMASKMRW